MRLSVVIPTYNRGPKLRATLDALLASATAGLDAVEVVVVDDGSATPAGLLVETFKPVGPFSLRCIRQANAGPAKARNTGFRATSGDIVLFMDDDILAPPLLLGQHVAAHRARPGCVIFGACPFVEVPPLTPLHLYLKNADMPTSSNGASCTRDDSEMMPYRIVASGQISVERSLFAGDEGVYCNDLATPAAEEFELSLRLHCRGIPILHAPRLMAWHDHPVAIDSMCRQQYKHAVGCAEVALKFPATLELPELRRVIEVNGPVASGDNLRQAFKKRLKRIAATRLISRGLVRLAQWTEAWLPSQVVLKRLYTAAISAHFWAGVRDGWKKYAGVDRAGQGR